MTSPSKHEPRAPGPHDEPSDIESLVLAHPLAWLVSGGDGFHATPLPLRASMGRDGEVTALLGHFARSNPQVEAVRRNPRALALFMGPQGYVSPSWLSDRTQAPTWNYAAAQFVVDVELIEDGEATRALLGDLIAAMEEGRPDAWRLEELGARYQRLAPRIIGFQAQVRETRPSFKLGQDEPDHFFAQILSGLDRGGLGDLRGWMEAARAPRA